MSKTAIIRRVHYPVLGERIAVAMAPDPHFTREIRAGVVGSPAFDAVIKVWHVSPHEEQALLSVLARCGYDPVWIDKPSVPLGVEPVSRFKAVAQGLFALEEGGSPRPPKPQEATPPMVTLKNVDANNKEISIHVFAPPGTEVAAGRAFVDAIKKARRTWGEEKE